MSNAFSGLGTKFLRWDSSNPTSSGDWEVIAEVISISGPTMTREFIDVTSLDSIGGYREFIAGFRDGGTVTLNMNFTSHTYGIMKTDFEDKDSQFYEIVLPDEDSTSFEFEGLVTELPLEIPADDRVTANVTIKVVGKVEVNSGEGPTT
ncbi:MAG: phage tail tube protein [Dysgonamonadaceae bacterium]